MASGSATLGVARETIPPAPVQIQSINASGTTVTVAFSKPLGAGSAQTAANYTFSPGMVSAGSAMLDATGTNVTLTTASSLPANTPMVLAIAGVKDTDGNLVAPGTTITFSYGISGGVVINSGAVTPAPGTLQFTSIAVVAGQMVIQWIGNGTLQQAPSAAGPWNIVANPGNAQTVPASGEVFFRLRQ